MKKLTVGLAVLTLVAGFLFQTEEAIAAVLKGLTVAFQRVVPALLPLSVLSGLAVSMGLFDGVCRVLSPVMRWFGLPAPAVLPLILGMLGGYPLGAQVVSGLLDKGQLTKKQAEAALGFCNNAGPAFVLGVAGVGVFQNAQTGVFLLVSHLLAAVGIGLLLAGFFPIDKEDASFQKAPTEGFGPAFSKVMQNSMLAMLRVAGYIAFFFYVTRMLSLLPTERLGPFEWLFWGGIELTNGLLRLAPGQELQAAFLLGLGGFCVFFQTAGVFAGQNISLKRYALGKLCQASLSVLLYRGLTGMPALLLICMGIPLFRFLLRLSTGKRKHHRV
ncbi:MAG TPA: hypothetical protein GX701_09805 [Clostridiales bacterium]|nr:hypothetical protein [Clostridiales bacterium]